MLNINNLKPNKIFSICTLVTDFNEYQEMIESFTNAGFNDAIAEFFYVDNSNGNSDDAFRGLNKFLNLVTGKYIILCHQDILLKYDNIDVLNQCIDEIDTLDPTWAILGNAGYAKFTEKHFRISGPSSQNMKIGQFPAKVKSLDENFLLIKNEANLSLSHDLEGFHMYGTDLCTIASILGWNSYVINFHLYHKSDGNCNMSFVIAKQAFIDKYSQLLTPRCIRTTCTYMIITGSKTLNYLLNRKIGYSIKKRIEILQKN